MADDALETLGALLGTAPPGGLAELNAEQLRDLTDAVREARRRQAAELAAAGDQAFAQIPWLLRGPIRKLFG